MTKPSADDKKEPLRKGQLLIVKVPPYFEKEYFYQVTSAGDKLVRAELYHSPKVRKSWTITEFDALLEHGIVRLARDDEHPHGGAELQKP